MLVSPSQQMTTSPSASSTSSGGTSGQSQPQHWSTNQFHDCNFRCVNHSTINLKWLGRSVLVGEYLILVLLKLWFYLSCPVHFWHETRLKEFVTFFCKSKIMKWHWWSRRTFWDKRNWCSLSMPSVECSVPWQPPNTERLPNNFLVIWN